jgi:hypothetical protein
MRRYAMKTYGGVDLQTQIFLTSALVGDEWSASRPYCFAPGTHFIGGWVDPRAGLDDMVKWKFFDPNGTRNFPPPLVVQPLASLYTDWAIPARYHINISSAATGLDEPLTTLPTDNSTANSLWFSFRKYCSWYANVLRLLTLHALGYFEYLYYKISITYFVVYNDSLFLLRLEYQEKLCLHVYSSSSSDNIG